MLVPKEVFGIAKHGDAESTRYGLGGVRFERTSTGPCATATCGRKLVTVSWDEPKDGEYPAIQGVNQNPKMGFVASVPLKACHEAAKFPPTRSAHPLLREYVVLDENNATLDKNGHGEGVVPLASTDLENAKVIRPNVIEGRFPRWRDVLPQYRDDQVVRYAVDPFYLADVLKTAGTFVTDENRSVELTIPLKADCPMLIGNSNKCAVKMTGVLMPLVHDGNLEADQKWRTANEEDCRRAIESGALSGKHAQDFVSCLTTDQLRRLLVEAAASNPEHFSVPEKVAVAETVVTTAEAKPDDTDLEADAAATDTELDMSPAELQELIGRLVAEQLALLDAA